MRLLIAGGGTGGHIYPALAVARSLHERADDAQIRWLGGHRGLEAAIVPPSGIRVRRLWLRSLRSVGRDVHLVLDPARLAASIPQAAALLAAWRPSAIFTTGGFVAIPVLLAAAAERIPVVLWEGNVIPGRSVRATARAASVVTVSFATTCETLASTGRPCYLTGTPIRDVSGIDPTAARERLGIAAGERMLLVFGGSQAVKRFNAAVVGALPRLVERVHVVHVTGDRGYPAALAARESLPAPLRERYRPSPFLRDDMLPTLAAADLVVGRAGSSTLAEVTALGRPLVVVPYPHAAGHQRANAEVLVRAGAARLIEDEAFDAEALLDASRILDDPATHARMTAAARSLARPRAADAVARLVLAAAARRSLPATEEIERWSRERTA
ncbi:MAG TPA: UDP-N-acetylglucosamine--N-acetylmuramyl-(pentapeptide) pyrophosphoryl-undecaprenol N-acetylglucosamine transferase [Candidatus Limnocylindrales bacterium]|nr:UDP-N-acetylglucosamine--N-acetylmuramyl-(pentapeptide) pyrophosphoryl-undecaprenol N-acetylglucosamine transferase [Candidatus Limnocylindrales bacterium]